MLAEDRATPVHIHRMTTTLNTYRVERVRAADLCDDDIALIDGRWREVVDVHTADAEGNWDEARNFYGEQSVYCLIGCYGEDGPVDQVLVRFFLTGLSKSGGIDDDFVLLDRVELVDVQVANQTSTATEGF